jgi:hypothetical protein
MHSLNSKILYLNNETKNHYFLPFCMVSHQLSMCDPYIGDFVTLFQQKVYFRFSCHSKWTQTGLTIFVCLSVTLLSFNIRSNDDVTDLKKIHNFCFLIICTAYNDKWWMQETIKDVDSARIWSSDHSHKRQMCHQLIQLLYCHWFRLLKEDINKWL